MKKYSKYILEFLAITFSILAAFWLDNVRENRIRRQNQLSALTELKSEIAFNKQVLSENMNILKNFNEASDLNQTLFEKEATGTISVAKSWVDSMKVAYEKNNRILANISNNHQGEYFFNNNISIDFFLGSLNYGMWESTKFSGVLIGMNPELIHSLFGTYRALQTEFGSTEENYHKALIQEDLDQILSATKSLERGFQFKLILLESSYDETVRLIDLELAKD